MTQDTLERPNVDDLSDDLNPAERPRSSGGKSGEKAAAAAEAGGAAAGGGEGLAGKAAGATGALGNFNFNPVDGTPAGLAAKIGGSLFGSRRRKQASIGGGLAGIIIGGVFFGFTIGSGPLQLIHLSEILAKNFNHSEETTQTRTRGLFRFARSGQIGETRVSYLGSRSYGKTVAALKDIGIEFETNKFSGALERATIDPKKLSAKVPELKKIPTIEGQKAYLSNFLKVDPAKIDISGGKLVLNTNADIKLVRTLNSRSTALLYSNKAVAALKARPLAKFLNAPSLWHPLKRAVANKENSIGTKLSAAEEKKKAQEAEKQRVAEQRAAADAKIKEGQSRIKGRSGGLKAAAGGALLVTAFACVARDSADDITNINNGIVTAASVEALDKEAIGSQLKHGGSDVEAVRVGVIVNNMGNVWKAKALKETAAPGSSSPNDPDIAPDVAQAFLPGDTAASIRDTLGLGAVGSVACSPLGVAVQTIGGLALIIAAIPSGGTSTALLFGGKVALSAAVTAGAFHLIHELIVNFGKNDVIIPQTLKDEAGGNILAYGARSAAGMAGRSSGEVLLSEKESQQIDQEELAASKREFMSKSFFARMFDVNDYRSLAGQTAHMVSPSMSQNLHTFASSLGSGRIFSSIFGLLIPHANAAAEHYKWASPRYAIPASVLNNPEFADPYANAAVVADIFRNDEVTGSSLRDRARKCFGANINKDSNDKWQVVPESAPNPNSSEYNSAHCNDMRDKNWQRMILFVADSRTMDALACLENDDPDSCKLNGFGPTIASSSEGSVGSAGGLTFPLKTTKATLTGKSGSVWCYTSLENCHHDYNAADIFAPTGTTVVAARAGTVLFAKKTSTVGSTVAIKATTGQVNYYAHMGDGTLKVSKGDTVTAGQELGAVGTDADAAGTPSHLHIDELPSTYSSRMSCKGAGCASIPFINIQAELVPAFNALP